jgi:hypothetical protein
MNRLADMSRVTDDAGVSVQITYRSSLCEECGYELHGLDPGHRCPECGHVTAPASRGMPRPADLAWRRTVAAGLALLLWVTLEAVAAVLIQPITTDLAASLPALNFPGPKVWAVPLLQRPIGGVPEKAGIAGTRAALLGVFALWLITSPRPRTGGAEPGAVGLRRLTRWTGLLLFGAAFGALMATHALWPSDLPPYRLVLVTAVELPATALLYAYLRRLADAAPGQDRRRAFAHLQWAVPLAMLAGAGMIAYQWLVPGLVPRRFPREPVGPALGAAYGCVVLACAAVAGTAVASLAGSFAAAGFAGAWRAVSGGRRLGAALWQQAQRLDGRRLRAAGVAAGLVLMLLVAVHGNNRFLWYHTRSGLAGNLPFFNFPGPKLYVAGAVRELSHSYWQGEISHAAFLALNITAVWLITLRTGGPSQRSFLRPLTRWVAIGAFGAAFGLSGGWAAFTRQLAGEFRSELFLMLTLPLELPATVLLYAYLARLARRELQRPRLRTQLALLAMLVPVLVCVSMAAFVQSRTLRGTEVSPHVLAASAAFGAAMFAAAAWAAVVVVSLAAALVRDRVLGSACGAKENGVSE